MALCSSLIFLVHMLIIQPNLMLYNARGRTEPLSITRIKQLSIRIRNLQIVCLFMATLTEVFPVLFPQL